MASIRISAVVPGTFDADPDEDADPGDTALRLEDVSMIVIGCGPVAEEFVRRRRSVGGRVCWLWSERFPLGERISPRQDPAIEFQTRQAAVEQQCDAHLSAWAKRVTDPRFDMSSFVWNPLRHGQRSSCGQQVWYGATLKRLRKRFGTSYVEWRTTGPDVVHVDSHEEYFLLGGCCHGHATGIQVVDSRDSTLRVLWEVSGKVVFAGQQFANVPSNLMTTQILSVDAASRINMVNPHEEAKPFVTVNARDVCVWGSVCFVQSVIFFILMDLYEKHMQPGDIPWWRASFVALTIAPLGYSCFPDLYGLSLTGRQLERRLAWFLSFIAILINFVACVLPMRVMGGQWRTCSLYVAQGVFFLVYSGISLLATACLWFRPRRELLLQAWSFRSVAHALWYIWILLGTFGTWVLLYGVSMLYIVVQQSSLVAASIFLPTITSLVEIGTLVSTVWIYRRLVYASRIHASGKLEQNCGMQGDQKTVMLIVLCMTHAYSESTRLISLMVPVVKQPSWNFIFPMLACFLTNICLRCHLTSEMLSRTVSPSWWFLFLPDSGTFMLNEVKIYFGYPRFVNLAALAFSNLILHGFTTWPLFNLQSSVLVVLACALEVIEDLIVCHGRLTPTSWMYKTSSYYRGMHPLNLSQVMSFDKNQETPSGFAIGFNGMRHLPFRCVVVVMMPSCMFGYSLMTLLLGAGFVHSACPTWIAEQGRLMDGLLWETPLRC